MSANSKKNDLSTNKESDQIRGKLYSETRSRFTLFKLTTIILYLIFATLIFSLFKNDFFTEYQTLKYVIFIDQDKRYKNIFNWITENSYDSYGRNIVTTKEIAKNCKMTEKEVQNICFYHPLIYNVKDKNGDEWTLYPDK